MEQQNQAEKLRALKSRMSQQSGRSLTTSQNNSTKRATKFPMKQENEEEDMNQDMNQELQPAVTKEQMEAMQQELQLIARFQDNGIYRLENIKSHVRSQDILIDFGSNLFERLDELNSNLSKIVVALENFGRNENVEEVVEDMEADVEEEQDAYD